MTSDVLDQPTATLLASGGDSRHSIDHELRNRYGCCYRPEPELVDWGSCTGSSVSELGYAAAERVHGWLRAVDGNYLEASIEGLFDEVRGSLIDLLARHAGVSTDVVITPSGTDAEYVPLLVAMADGREIDNIVVGPTEAGSGTVLAAAGRHFDPICPDGSRVDPGSPVDDQLADRVTAHPVALRYADSSERDVGEINAEVTQLVGEALRRGARALIHVISHSKTGVHAPSLDVVAELSERHPDQVLVVVDAAQGRISRRGLADALRRRHMVIISGSKFFGGPPFEGAVLVPSKLARFHGGLANVPTAFGAYLSGSLLPTTWRAGRAQLPSLLNVGLVLRWFAALADMREYYLVPSRLRLEVLRAFERLAPTIFDKSTMIRLEPVSPPLIENKAHRLLESKTTVFPFRASDPVSGKVLTHAELTELHTLMRSDLSGSDWAPSRADDGVLGQRILLGQPVRIGDDDASVLRIALGGGRIVRSCGIVQGGQTFKQQLEHMQGEIELARSKLETLLKARHSWGRTEPA